MRASRFSDQGELRVGFIPGVEPDVFARRWRSDSTRPALTLVPIEAEDQEAAALRGEVDMVFARLPFKHEHFHQVRLWEERPVAVISVDHDLTLHDELTEADLSAEVAFEPGIHGNDKERVEIVATGVGYAIMPMSLARFHHRKDVTYRPIKDRQGTHIALVWPVETDDDLRQEFVAVVRGRTSRSPR